MSYVGRFAPSPTGPLHIGSLATAVASFLHARQSAGSWLVRIEDIDPPREVRGAADEILRTLEALRALLGRPGDLSKRSTRRLRSRVLTAPELGGSRFAAAARAARCAPTATGPPAPTPALVEPGRRTIRRQPCESESPTKTSFVSSTGCRVRSRRRSARLAGDYVIWRRDGLPAYHLAVVIDDADEGVTTIVRGVDLLDSTAAHLHLQTTLGLPSPAYFHLPVVVNADGQKLSKQTGAAPIGRSDPGAIAASVLDLLGARSPRRSARSGAGRSLALGRDELANRRPARPTEACAAAGGGMRASDDAALRGVVHVAHAEPNPALPIDL